MSVSSVLSGMMFFLPILSLYLKKELFTATNVALIFSVEALTMVLLEVPTGAIADLFGRKRTIIASYSVALSAILVLAIGGGLIMFLLYAVLNACARSLSSGTASAMIYDSLQEEGKKHEYKKLYGIFESLWPFGASLSSIFGGYLAQYSLHLTVTVSALPMLLAVVLSCCLREPHYERAEHRNIGRHMLHSSRLVVRNRQLLVLLIAYFVMMALGESVHLLSPLFFEFKQLPFGLFGWASALTFGFSSLGFYLSHAVSELMGAKKALVYACMFSPLFILTATLLAGLPLVFIWTFASVFFGIKNPIISHMLNAQVVSRERATILSMNNFMGQLGVALIAPLFGYFADVTTIQTAVRCSAILVLIVPLILLFLRDREAPSR